MATDPLTRLPLRGQDEVWRRIGEAVAAAVRRRRSTLILVGGEGAGKTRIMRELAIAAKRAGCIVLVDPDLMAQADEPAAVRPLIVPPGGRLVMVLCDRSPASPWRFEAVTDVPVLYVGTRRAPDEPWYDLVDGVDTWVAVPPLPAAAVAEMVGDLTRVYPVPAPLTDVVELAAAAAGIPGAVVDLVAGLAEDLSETRPTPAAPLALPRRFRARLVAQLRATSPDARDVVALASRAGSTCTVGDIARVLHVSVVAAARAIDEAVSRGLLVARDGGGVGFAHDQVRQLVRTALDPVMASAFTNALVCSGHCCAPAPTAIAEPDGVAPAEDPDWELLSPTQRQIAAMVRDGLTNRDIASRLYLSPYTVNYHLRQIFKKLGITTRMQLALRGLR